MVARFSTAVISVGLIAAATVSATATNHENPFKSRKGRLTESQTLILASSCYNTGRKGTVNGGSCDVPPQGGGGTRK